MSFKDYIEKFSKQNNSNIVVALDIVGEDTARLLTRCITMLEMLSHTICAVKINRHLLLPLGLFGGVERIVNRAHDLGIPTIMDCKMSDIGSTNLVMAENFFKAGFDGITVSPFVGWKDGLEPVFNLAHDSGRGVLVVVHMSHKGVDDFYEQNIVDPTSNLLKAQYRVFAEKTLEWKAEGAVIGATKPEKIVEVRRILGDEVPIYSPGVGFQGGSVEEAVKNGARFLIVGRSVINAQDPIAAAEALRKRAQEASK